jgi:hypothetical protein
MRAFEVRLNDKKLCLPGVGNEGVLTTMITSTPFRSRSETQVYVSGLILPQDEHVVWKRSRLRTGDELRVKIVEAEAVDKPRERFPRDPSAEEKRKKRYVLEMAKQLGCKIQRPNRSR